MQLNKLIKKELNLVLNSGFFHLLGANGLVFIAGFASQFFVADFLNAADLGRIRIMQTYISIGALFAGLGLNVSIVKLTAENRNEEYKKQILWSSLVATILSFIFIHIVLIILNQFRFLSNDEIVIQNLPIYSLFLLTISIQALLSGYFQGTGKIKLLSKIQGIIKIISVLIIILATYLNNFYGYVIAVVTTGFIGNILLFYRIPKIERQLLYRVKNSFSTFKQSFSLSKMALLTNISGTFYSSMDILFLNKHIKDMTQIGFYSFAITIISILNILPQTIQQVTYSKFSSLSNNFEQWRNAYKKYNLINHISIIGIAILLALTIPPSIDFVFKMKYHNSIQIFLFLCISWSFSFMNNIKSNSLMGQGAFNFNFISSIVLLIASIPLYYFLTLLYGINGAIGAKIILGISDYFITSVVFYTFLRRKKNESISK